MEDSYTTCHNNEAEYEAAIYTLKTALSLGATKVDLYTDSKLLASQFSGAYQARESRMASYLGLVKELARKFESISITQKPRNDIRHADSLAYIAAALDDPNPRSIIVETQEDRSIELPDKNYPRAYLAVLIYCSQVPRTAFMVAPVTTRKRQRALEAELEQDLEHPKPIDQDDEPMEEEPKYPVIHPLINAFPKDD